MKSDLKINYGILEDIINQLHKYQGALGNMREALSNIDSFVETNYGESIDAWKDKIKTSELNIKEYEIQIKDLLSLFENYVTDTTSIIYPLEKYIMMRVNRNNIKKNLREIESGMSNNVTKAFYRTLDDPPGNWKFWDDISDAEKEASRYNKGRIESISQDILNTKMRLDNKMAEMWKIYDSKVVPFENMDDEYKGKADVIKDKYTTFWEGFWDTFGILESAGDLFRGIVDFALDTVEGLIALSEDAGIIIVSAIIPDAIEPDFLKQEAYDRLQPYKQALIQVIEDPKGVVENMVNSFTEMVEEEGMMYAIGYSGSSFIPMAGATKFTKLTKINDREAELKQYVDKTVKSNKSFEGVRLSPVEIVKNVRKFGSNLVNEVLGGMTALQRMLDSKEVPVLSGISSKNINVFDTGYLKGKAKEFYSWFRANVVGNGKSVNDYLNNIVVNGKVDSTKMNKLKNAIQNNTFTVDELSEIRKKMSKLGITKEYDEVLIKMDFGKYLRGLIGNPPTDMINPHAHHILFKKGLGQKQQELVREGQEILRRYGIDPIIGEENLVWAPNAIVGQHSLDALEEVVNRLRAVEFEGGDIDDMIETLKELGILASRR
ncbi:AHH domain-containing protein [Salirhabdus sp. Marseille-P4669]|uniref:AHH domain-containing protein n=1 Tax=Salirhabdus sp. Marseille-P4669 TaxID=2042310 RepID=UPI001F41B170|nr:AHH domain-containing protein [Salirhabdus sp. Marseille-P4669]